MLKIDIPASDVELLRHERYNHPHPRVQIKMDVLLLKALGLPNALIRQITGVCENTMREYWKQYKEGGIERLKEVKFYRPGSELQEHSHLSTYMSRICYTNLVHNMSIFLYLCRLILI